MTHLELSQLDVRVARHPVVHDVALTLAPGDIGCLLGPSGCGKTTILRAIAGFVQPSRGEIRIGDAVVHGKHRSLPTERRGIGMVFQDFALFPHLDVRDNVGFGLRGWSKERRHERIEQLLRFVELDARARAYPHELSGGEQQRIALARAMAPRPSLLLLDEPFASMDVELRSQLARDLRRSLKTEGVTALVVTHDQDEAFVIADQVVVLEAGRIQQQGTPYELYHRPATRFVADFVGEGVFIPGEVNESARVETPFGTLPSPAPATSGSGQAVEVLVRPDDVVCVEAGDHLATVSAREFRGSSYLYTLTTDAGIELLSLMPTHHGADVGDVISFDFDLQHLNVYPREA